MAEMKATIESLKAILRVAYDHNQMALLLHYLKRFDELYGTKLQYAEKLD